MFDISGQTCWFEKDILVILLNVSLKSLWLLLGGWMPPRMCRCISSCHTNLTTTHPTSIWNAGKYDGKSTATQTTPWGYKWGFDNITSLPDFDLYFRISPSLPSDLIVVCISSSEVYSFHAVCSACLHAIDVSHKILRALFHIHWSSSAVGGECICPFPGIRGVALYTFITGWTICNSQRCCNVGATG